MYPEYDAFFEYDYGRWGCASAALFDCDSSCRSFCGANSEETTMNTNYAQDQDCLK